MNSEPDSETVNSTFTHDGSDERPLNRLTSTSSSSGLGSIGSAPATGLGDGDGADGTAATSPMDADRSEPAEHAPVAMGEPAVTPAGPAELIRLQKVLAAAGVGSRRTCEQLIAAGRVAVDGEVVDQLGARVDPQTAIVEVDGRQVSVRPGLVHLALNKPVGILSAMSDDRGRPTVGDLLRDRPERLFHVGRLDADSEGLLLLTNDGDLAHRLMHPSHGVSKTYLVEVDGVVTRAVSRRVKSGVELEDGPVRVDSFRLIQESDGRSLVEVVLHEGRNRIVRRLLAEVGHPVRRLVRTAIGPVQLGSQRDGALRELSLDEVSSLYTLTNMATKR